MKRIFILLSICAFASACEVNTAAVHETTAEELFSYSSGLIGRFITLPVETTEMLLAFDDYMKLSDDDKESDTRFYGKIIEIYDNVYHLNDQVFGTINCTVDTGGKSLKEEGTVWTFAELNAYDLYEQSINVTYGYYNFFLPAYTTLTTTDAENQVWTMASEELFETVMQYKGNNDGRNMWSVKSEGKVTEISEGNTLSAIFSTGDSPVEMKERKTDENQYYNIGNAYSGKFYVETYCVNDRLHYCHITLRPGFATKYETGR